MSCYAREAENQGTQGIEDTVDKAPKKRLRPKLTKAVVTPEAEAVVDKAPKNLPTKRHDYERARHMYVEQMDSSISLRDVAEALGINYALLRRKAADERWTAQRADFQSKAALDMAKQRVKRLVKEGEMFDEATLQAAKVGQALIAGRLAQLSQLFQAQQSTFSSAVQRIKQGLPVPKEDLYGAFYPKDMTELARSLELFQKAGKLAIGIDTTNFDPKKLDDAPDHEDDDVDIKEELRKPDMDRLAAFAEALERSGLADKLFAPDDIEDAEVVDDEGVRVAPRDTPLTDEAGDTTEETPDQPAA